MEKHDYDAELLRAADRISEASDRLDATVAPGQPDDVGALRAHDDQVDAAQRDLDRAEDHFAAVCSGATSATTWEQQVAAREETRAANFAAVANEVLAESDELPRAVREHARQQAALARRRETAAARRFARLSHWPTPATATATARTGTRARGAGRPKATASRSSAASGDSGDGDPEPPRPARPWRDPRGALLRLIDLVRTGVAR